MFCYMPKYNVLGLFRGEKIEGENGIYALKYPDYGNGSKVINGQVLIGNDEHQGLTFLVMNDDKDKFEPVLDLVEFNKYRKLAGSSVLLSAEEIDVNPNRAYQNFAKISAYFKPKKIINTPTKGSITHGSNRFMCYFK